MGQFDDETTARRRMFAREGSALRRATRGNPQSGGGYREQEEATAGL